MRICEVALRAQVVNADKEMLPCSINGSTTGAFLVGALHDADMRHAEYTVPTMLCNAFKYLLPQPLQSQNVVKSVQTGTLTMQAKLYTLEYPTRSLAFSLYKQKPLAANMQRNYK